MRHALSASAVLLAAWLAVPATAQAQGPQADTERIAALAASARTAKDHTTVAAEYRDRGTRFEAKAREHEEAARRYDRRRTPLQNKYPAAAHDRATRERQLAMEARRAARESFQLADRHVQLSVDLLADASERTNTARP